MAERFRNLVARTMTPEAQARSAIRTRDMLADLNDAPTMTPICPKCGLPASHVEPLVIDGQQKAWCPNAHSFPVPSLAARPSTGSP